MEINRNIFTEFLAISIDQKSLTMSGFLNSLEASGWLKHVRAVLDTSG